MHTDIRIIPIHSRQDNYIWAYVNEQKKQALVVDPGEAEPVMQFLEENSLQLKDIFITHHHYDHVDGLPSLIEAYQPKVYGSKADNITGITDDVIDGELIEIPYLNKTFEVLFIPGHTNHHLAYYSAPDLFCGDTLFSVGCGRLSQGSIEDLFASLLLIKSLPDDTLVYCAHEYTLKNIQFAKQFDANNKNLEAYEKQVLTLRDTNTPSIPALLKTENLVNPFLRCDDKHIQKAVSEKVGRELKSEFDVFKNLRLLKDSF